MKKLTLIIGPPRAGKTTLTFSGKFSRHKYFPYNFVRSYCRQKSNLPKDIDKSLSGDGFWCREKRTVAEAVQLLFAKYDVIPKFYPNGVGQQDRFDMEEKFLLVADTCWKQDDILIEGEYISKSSRFEPIISLAHCLGRVVEVHHVYAKPRMLLGRCTSEVRTSRYDGYDNVALIRMFDERMVSIRRMIACVVSDIDLLRQIDTGKEDL